MNTRNHRRPGFLPLAVIVMTIIFAMMLLPGASRADVPQMDFDHLPADTQIVPGGFTVVGCGPEAPLLCVDEDGTQQGVIEHLAFPLESFMDLADDIDAGTPLRPALIAEIDRFHVLFRGDR